MTAEQLTTRLTRVCEVDRILPESGVAALVDGEAVAVFRDHRGDVYALSNYCPFAQASVLSRGILGTKTIRAADGEQEEPFVASPVYKQPFSLRTGECLTDATVRVATFEVHVLDGWVHIGERSDR